MIRRIKTEENLKYNPTFESNSLVRLTIDCTDTPGGYVFFTKNRFCQVFKCGLSCFFEDDNYESTGLVEDCEFCIVEAIVENSEYENNPKYGHPYEEPVFSGVMRAKDLGPVVETDLDELLR